MTPPRYPWRRALHDIVDVLLIGALTLAGAVFAVVALMMLDGFEPPPFVVAFAAMIGGAHACLSLAGILINRHIRWRP